MGCIGMFAVVFLAAWADCFTVRAMVKGRAGLLCWLTLTSLLLVGLAVGVWCGFYCEYQPSPRLRFFSFPVPAVVFVREGGRWVDYVGPVPVGVALFNAVTVLLLFPLPLSAVYGVQRAMAWRAGERARRSGGDRPPAA